MAQAIRRFSSLLKGQGFLNTNVRQNGLRVINKTGSSIAANKLVCLNGYDSTSKHIKVVLADADAAGLANEVFVTKDAIADGSKGHIYKGFMSPATMNTNGASVGDTIYLDTTAGGFALTNPPTSAAARVVPVGYVHVVSATVGQILWDVQDFEKIGSSDTASIGFATGNGVGGAVTQTSSRTTGVTLSNMTGAITLVSAAGSATPATFTVTNTLVAATDVVVLSQKSGSDKYELFVTAVGSGSFNITFFTTGGTTTEQPVFNFVVIKGSAN